VVAIRLLRRETHERVGLSRVGGVALTVRRPYDLHKVQCGRSQRKASKSEHGETERGGAGTVGPELTWRPKKHGRDRSVDDDTERKIACWAQEKSRDLGVRTGNQLRKENKGTALDRRVVAQAETGTRETSQLSIRLLGGEARTPHRAG